MRKFSKAIKYSLMISSFMITATSHLQAASCPTLNRDQIRTLCRWDALKNIPLLKIDAKKITIDGATLQNKHDTCREADSIKQFLTKNATSTYEGKASKDFKNPNDHSQVLCLYHIDNEVYGFSAEGVPHPDAGAKKENTPPPVHRKDPRTFGGVDITVSPKVQQVPLHEPTQPTKKEPTHIHPQTAPQRPNQPPISDPQTGPNPLPGKRMRAIPPQESPPPRPAREVPTQSGGTPPPNYSPPPIPSKAPQRPLQSLPNKGQYAE